MMLTSQIQEDLKKAQFERDELKVGALRLLLSELHNMEIQKQKELSEEDIIATLQKEIKKRKEAIVGFKAGGREDQAQKEEKEAKILADYLPEQLSNEELTHIVDQAINELGAKSLNDLGRVMSEVMVRVKGQADGGAVSNLVRQKLS